MRDGVKRNHLHFKWQDPHLSFLEGIFSMGDRNLSRVLVEAFRLGCRFDGWSDQFHYPLWKEAFEKTGMDMDSHTRKRKFEDTLPWSFIETGMDAQFLWEEYQRGLKEKISPPCVREICHRCGICDGKTITVREGDPVEIKASGKHGKKRPPKERDEEKDSIEIQKGGRDAIPQPFRTGASLLSCLKEG